MTIPAKAIDRLFERLLATYGSGFSALWRGVPIEVVKQAWAHELGGFANRLDAIAWALEHLPERAPNAIEFRNLARQAPREQPAALPAPLPDRATVAPILAHAKALMASAQSRPGLDWAQRILDRQAAGEYVHFAAAQAARAAINRGRIDADAA